LKRVFHIVAAWLLILPLASAQQSHISRQGGQWVQETTGSLSGARILRVKVDVGSVQVQGGSQPDIHYVIQSRSYSSSEDSARREFDAYKISAYVRGDTAYITGDWQGHASRKFSGNFVINVPRNVELVKLETEGGNVGTNGIAGRLEAESGGGSIHLDDIGGNISAVTGGGSIDVGNVGADLSLHTGGGRIEIHSAKGKVNAESGGGSVVLISGLQGAVLQTGGGSIQVRECGGTIKATTGGGSIELGDIGGPATLETGGGSIRLTSAKGPVRAETGGGSIELNGVPGAHAETAAGGITAKFVADGGKFTDSYLETTAGDITVYLASDLHVTVRANIELANGHSIHSDFPEIRVATEGGDYGPKTVSAEGSLNGGGPILKVTTQTGDIWFRHTR
jgi:DUF4097 and DUF4098 domain-containing protein YvlB